jgi:UDP-N-acetylglucosamine 1-carboxyvinyltransferase
MKKLIIRGPSKLSGSIKIQGAKNSAAKLVLLPLLINDKFTFTNVPRIGDSSNLLEIIKLHNVKVKWIDKHKVALDSTNMKKCPLIPKELFYYTSGAVFLVTILTSRFGECNIEKHPERKDYGGCKISSRAFSLIIDTIKSFGIRCQETNKSYHFERKSFQAFDFTVPVRSFSATVNAVFSALFSEGICKISEITTEPDFLDILEAINKMGAGIIKKGNILTVECKRELHGIDYECVSDRNDFMTWLSATLATNSSFELKNIDYKRMGLEQMEKVVKDMNIKLEFSKNSCFVPAQLDTIKPTTIKAGRYPDFQTEWQVLFAPLLTQINGKSKVIELLYPNRMNHWKELEKMDANYKFLDSKIIPKFEPKEGEKVCNTVKITGPTKLKGAKVHANDVRSGAALVIAGLVAEGKTEITGVGEIERGYEDLKGRLKKVTVDIK